MSNNEPDYDNLAFDPSALNPCNEGKRGSDVLMTTLEKCQAIVSKNVELEKKLKIAEGALEKVKNAASFGRIKGINVDTPDSMRLKAIVAVVEETLKKIKEQPDTLEEMKTTCDICGKEIVGIENFIDAGDKVVCSRKCLETAISEFYHWQNTKG